ncbi:MAG: hypothetical protein DMG96_29865 [Acidobacteria bacterium]|nr:MAG: hypothetical protein DMG96_29865 [Acidobacteriota bacterium]
MAILLASQKISGAMSGFAQCPLLRLPIVPRSFKPTGCAWHLASLVRKLRPSAILVEGPSSFTPCIPTILDPGTKPPVAIYTHFIDVERKLTKPRERTGRLISPYCLLGEVHTF